MYWKLGIVILLFGMIGCHPPDSSNEFVARVGDAYLLESDVTASLEDFPVYVDTMATRANIIDQWISRELLYQEALRQELAERQEIQHRLRENTRTVLIDAMISEYNHHADDELSPEAIAQYYESYKEQLRFLGPFVSIQYLSHPIQDSLMTALQMLRQNSTSDSTFIALLHRFSLSPEDDLTWSENYYLENSLFLDLPELRRVLQATVAGSPPQVILADSVYHLLHVLDRSQPGAIPELPWIEGFIREQLGIRLRTQNYNRNIQRLRVEAEFRDEIEIR